MGHWNYRVIRYADGGYGLHEVYYNIEGDNKESWTLEPISFTCGEEEGQQGIVESLKRALRDAENRPVLQIDETWAQLFEEAQRSWQKPEPPGGD